VMSEGEQLTEYSQEIDRVALDQQISARALEEVYLPPFKAAVERANVASIMCSYGAVDGTPDCSDPRLFHLLYTKWGFHGFVRSDLGAVGDAPAAFAAGLDAIKPAEPGALALAIRRGTLAESRLDDAVGRVLTEMFDYHLIEHPIVGRVDTPVDTRAHSAVALSVAEQSMVLLKNHDGILPLSRSKPPSIAVIGVDGAAGATSAGEGSAYVDPPFVSTPYSAIRSIVAKHASVTYAPGGTALAPEPALAGWPVIPPTGLGAGLLSRTLGSRLPGGQRSIGIIGTGSFGRAYSSALHYSSASVVAPTTGEYVFSMSDSGDSWLSLDGQSLISAPGIQGHSTWSVGEHLVAGHRYKLGLSWYPVGKANEPVVGWRFVQPEIDQAVTAARQAKVAIVFASAPSGENHDRPTLSLPGDENALIEAVAAVNRHTIVVLNSGGAVLMPWLSKVAGVLEAWYPGEEDGVATAAVLFGKVDPSGHLPVTFPATNSETPVHSSTAWPGVDGVVSYAEGLDVGYRYEDANGLTPLFPFGYGLSYTTFSLSDLEVTQTSTGYDAQVTVTDTGSRAGREVVQGYLQFPFAAGEPPLQLKAFSAVELAAGETATVTLPLSGSDFQSFQGNSWTVVPGSYGLFVGDSSDNLPLHGEITLPAPSTAAAHATSS